MFSPFFYPAPVVLRVLLLRRLWSYSLQEALALKIRIVPDLRKLLFFTTAACSEIRKAEKLRNKANKANKNKTSRKASQR